MKLQWKINYFWAIDVPNYLRDLQSYPSFTRYLFYYIVFYFNQKHKNVLKKSLDVDGMSQKIPLN